MCGSSPSAPTPPPKTPEAPRAPDVSGQQNRARKRRGTIRSTILTSPGGVDQTLSTPTATKTLLGQ